MEITLGFIFFNIKNINQETIHYYLDKNNHIVKLEDFYLINTNSEYRKNIFENSKKITNRSFKIRHTRFVKQSFEDINVSEVGSTWVTEKDFCEGKFIY